MKQKKIYYFYLFALVLFNNTCREESHKTIFEKHRVIVVCDASNSTTLYFSKTRKKINGGLEKLKYYTKIIPKWYPFESEIYFYPVSDNVLSKQLGMVSYKIKKTNQLIPEKERVEKLTDVINDRIDTLATTTSNSCILFSIKRAIIRMQEIKRDNPNEAFTNELIIISDMLECCHISDTHTVNMSAFNSSQLNSSIKEFEKVNSRIDIENLDLKVRVIINSPGMHDLFSNIKSTWENWFYKIGIKKENLIINTDEPEIKENPLLNRI